MTTNNSKILSAPLLQVALIAAASFGSGCRRDPEYPFPVAARPPGPMPVLCSEQPQGNQVAVTCQYYYAAQAQEAWDRSVERATLMAVSLGYGHVQYIHSTHGVNTAASRTPVECSRAGAWNNNFNCKGGDTVHSYRSSQTTAYFALLTAEEAAARSNDPLIPADRRPIDARQFLAARTSGQAGPPPQSQDAPSPAAPKAAAPAAAPSSTATW